MNDNGQTRTLHKRSEAAAQSKRYRTTCRINLTPDGEEFYHRSKPLLAQADELLESFSSERVLRGQLRVDSLSTQASFTQGTYIY